MDQLNHNIIEQDIERLTREIKERQLTAESKGVSERELIKQTIYPLVKQRSAPVIQLAEPSLSAEERMLPDYLKDSPQEIKLKVEQLIDLTFHHGIEKAASEARKSNPFILDAYHDALTDKLYEELKSRGLI